MATKALSLAKRLAAGGANWRPQLRQLFRQPVGAWSAWLARASHLRHRAAAPTWRLLASAAAGHQSGGGGAAWAAVRRVASAAAAAGSVGGGSRGGRRLVPLAALSLGLGLTGDASLQHSATARATRDGDGDVEAAAAAERAVDRAWEAADRALPRPRGLADLEFVRLVGRGGYSTVVEARATATASAVCLLAVKRHFNPGVESLPASLESHFDRERRILGGLSHPGVARVLAGFAGEFRPVPGDCTEAPAFLPSSLHQDGCGRNATYYTVMPLYDCSLADYLASSDGCGLPTAQTLLWLAQLAEADAHLKARGVAHRDVKSTNVAVRAGRLVLIDFGQAASQLRLALPHADVVAWGNASLAPPEVARARPGPGVVLDYSRADLWALASLAWEMLGLANPFLAPAGPRAWLPYGPEDLPSLAGRLGPRADRLLRRLALAEDPARRPTPDWVARALRRLLGEERRRLLQRQRQWLHLLPLLPLLPLLQLRLPEHRVMALLARV